MNILKAKDIMTTNVVTAHPEASIGEAYNLVTENRFNGLPVVDSENKLVGILTEYDFLAKESLIHMPTYQKLISNIVFNKKNEAELKKEIDVLKARRVKDIMNSDPMFLEEDAPFKEIVEAFHDHHKVNPLPVVDKNHKVTGVISRHDIIKFLAIMVKL